MKFYPEVGVKRDVSSKPSTEYYALRAFLSVKWLFIEEEKEEQNPMPGFRYVDTQNTFNLYENDNFLPMGFAYDYYILREEFDKAATSAKSKLLLKAIVLEEDDADYNSDILWPLDLSNCGLGYDDFTEDVKDRRTQCTDYFEKDNRGFSAHINLSKENLVFFSVPYEEGWSVTVNGEPAEVIKANIGFMAVRCPEGECDIRFQYMTPGLIYGIILSVGGLILLAGYLALFGVRKMMGNRKEMEIGQVVPDQFSENDENSSDLSKDDFLYGVFGEMNQGIEEENEDDLKEFLEKGTQETPKPLSEPLHKKEENEND